MKIAIYSTFAAILVAILYFVFGLSSLETPAGQGPASTGAATGETAGTTELAAGPGAISTSAVPLPERPTVPDQLELRTQIADADTRLMSALEAAYERVLAEGKAIDGFIDEAGMVQHSSPLPPEPRFVRQLDVPEEPKPAPGPEEKRDEGSGTPKRVRTLVLTQANAPEVFALQAELESLRARLR